MDQGERRYRRLVEHSLGLVCAHDLDGNVLFVNPAAAQSLGYGPGEGVGRNLREFLAPDTGHLFDAYLRRIRDHRMDEGLMKVVDKSGRERVWMYRNVRSEEPGERPYVVGHALDITERMTIEQALRKSQHGLKRAFAELDARVQKRTAELRLVNERLLAEIAERERAEETRERALVRERNVLGFMARANERFARGLDYEQTLAMLVQLPVPFLADWTLLHTTNHAGGVRCLAGSHADPVRETLVRLLAAEGPDTLPEACSVAKAMSEVEGTVVTGAGERFVLDYLGPGTHVERIRELGAADMAIVPLVVEDTVIGALSLFSMTPGRFSAPELAVVEDLVRRFRIAIEHGRLYRQAQDANRLKDDFLATLSHELRTPLNAILGWARILRTGRNRDSADHAAEVIERNAEAQMRLIEDILDVSRIVTGKLALDVRPVHLPQIVSAALDSIRPAAQAKSIRLVERIESTESVMGDAHRLQQVIWNLLSNAVKFTEAGGTVTVGVLRTDRVVEITVADTGVGIRREVLPFVFDRFRQADPSTTRIHGGLGLGLAIVRHLVELHGGTVRVRSTGGDGTCFGVEIPVSAPRAGGDRPRPSLREGPSPEDLLGGRHVVVVDDNADSRDLAAAIFRMWGASVTTTASAADALKIVAKSNPHLLVSDIGLPDMDGYALIRQIRALPPEWGGRVLAIALTGYARAEDRQLALSAGFDRHVPKPVEPAVLIEIIKSLLRSEREERT